MKRSMMIILIAALFCSISTPHHADARVLGQVGSTWQIIEKDALTELQEKAAKVNWKKVFNDGYNRANKTFGKAFLDIPMAEKSQRREMIPRYVLPFDVPDPSNISKVLYPAGYEFNPLEYMEFPGRVVFVDAANKKQLAWLKTEYGKGSNGSLMDIIMLTGGDANKVEGILNRPVYIAAPEDIERFGIEVVPSVYVQEGPKFIISEIGLGDNK